MGFLNRQGLWLTLSLTAAVVAVAVGLVGCGDDGANSGGGGGDGSLVCADGEAWVGCDMEDGVESCIGYIFKSNSELIFIERESDGVWYRFTDDGYKWRINENALIIYDDENEGIIDYSLTRGVLTLTFDGNAQTYTKKKGIHPVLLKSRAGADMSKFLLNLKKY